jgi:hypothetical protein
MAQRATTNYENNSRTGILPVAFRLFSWESGNPGMTRVRKQFYVYILASQRNGTLYIGVTSNLIGRNWQHKQGLVEGFSAKYHVKKLVYFEVHDNAPWRDREGKADQEMEKGLEVGADRRKQPGLERPV